MSQGCLTSPPTLSLINTAVRDSLLSITPASSNLGTSVDNDAYRILGLGRHVVQGFSSVQLPLRTGQIGYH